MNPTIVLSEAPSSSSGTNGAGKPSPSSPAPEDQAATNHLRYSSMGCLVAALLIAMGSGLDHFTYPNRFEDFLYLRGVVASALVGIWAVLNTPFGARHVRYLSLIWVLIPQVMISWMIYDTNGAESSYFAGLLLAMFAVGTVLPVTFFESAFFGCATLLLYSLACTASADGFNGEAGASFFTHSMFIVLSAITSAVCAYLNAKSRNQLIQVKDDLSDKNKELQEVNHALSQIKGHLLEREKIAAAGAMSAGLLQRLNAPVNHSMMAINMGLGMSAVRGDKMLTETLQDARESMERIGNIVSDLRSFAQPEPIEGTHASFELHMAVRAAIRLTSFDLKGIAMSVEVPRHTLVLGDEPALIGVLINLLSNAAHSVNAIKHPYPTVQLRAETKDDRVEISVRDNGPGIRKEFIGRVFEPFFTTRGMGSGLGLGLSISQTVVRRHGSEITVQSEPGAWTEFAFGLAIGN